MAVPAVSLNGRDMTESGIADLLAHCRAMRDQGRPALDEPTGKRLLSAFGLRVPVSRTVAGADDLAAIGASLRPPYVLKVVSTQVLHKSDVGGVSIGLADVGAVAAEIEAMRIRLEAHGVRADRWLVEEMAPAGVEMVIGGIVDPEFGPMVMAGLGGVFIEVLRDVAFRICPIDRVDAQSMLEDLRGVALLRGARGRKPVDEEAIIDALLKIGGEAGVMMACLDDVAEVDINPLIVGEDGAFAADARFVLRA